MKRPILLLFLLAPGLLPGTAFSADTADAAGVRQAFARFLGDGFDVRAFHDQVLGNGAVPIDILEKNIQAWVGERKAAAAK